MGKPIKYSQTVDVGGAANCIRWYGEAIDKIYDEIAPTPANSLALITREPVGVVAAIVPWNYPMLMASWKIAPALAAGNSVVLKPSEKSPLTALRLAEIALEAGVPPGVFNVLPGLVRRLARRWRCTWMWTVSALPAPPAWASRSCRWRGSRT
jgi:gamma-glutamyl-gamma-aminobutyraldehyde dehydrogenase/4-guanidinobutyraldehyde dehydrogenase/NAD-dependent aldehyde dehydrogenase